MDIFDFDISPTVARANVQRAYNEALAALARIGKTERDAERLLAAGLGRSIRPAWYELAWEVVSAAAQLKEMEAH